LIDKAVINATNESVLNDVKHDVMQLMSGKPLFKF
jgi:hypothetical protein